MAPHRRFLFYPTDAPPNFQIVNCSEWCSNGGNCFDFCSPPSPALIPPPIVAPPPIPIEIILNVRHVPTLVIVLATVLTTCLLLLVYFGVLLKKRSDRHRLRASVGPPQMNNPDNDDGDDEGEEETHHIWYIRTVGLDEQMIDSITICSYKRGEGLIEVTDCSVCLNDFRDGELVRLLPKCSHAFHIPCIDTWLKSHVNCPLCRAPIIAPSVGPGNPSSSSVTVTVEPSSSRDAQNLNFPPSENNGIDSVEGREDGTEVSGSGIVIDSECSLPILVSGSTAESSLEDCNGIKIDALVAQDVAADAGLQPVRRSVSMDSPSMASLLCRVESEGSSDVGVEKPNFDEGVATKDRVKLESCFKGVSVQKGPLGMERSLSSGGGRFFLSRYGRGRNSILPL